MNYCYPNLISGYLSLLDPYLKLIAFKFTCNIINYITESDILNKTGVDLSIMDLDINNANRALFETIYPYLLPLTAFSSIPRVSHEALVEANKEVLRRCYNELCFQHSTMLGTTLILSNFNFPVFKCFIADDIVTSRIIARLIDKPYGTKLEINFLSSVGRAWLEAFLIHEKEKGISMCRLAHQQLTYTNQIKIRKSLVNHFIK